MNIIAGSLVGGIYLGIVFSSGSGAVEAYIERVSRANRFEYGKVRVAGCVGWAPIARPFRCVRRQSCCVCRASGALSSMWWVSPASTTCLTSSSPTFSKSFFASPQRGTEVFGFVTTGGELLNALIMFCAPAIVNRIGAKNALLTAGMIMSVRILGVVLRLIGSRGGDPQDAAYV
ncbi:putative proton/sugar symporter, LacY [Klebsiella pneumoniae]|uniref:Putative proton/sugar symporter, LacY n=1 Tax=Klebsiella pneumoniae TaxID=573 RepID=A0A377X8K1_KLEPN|nr:putative proton/sugar symporter, LacY [Klebsiella pneumoniae]